VAAKVKDRLSLTKGAAYAVDVKRLNSISYYEVEV
jgi:hypothetical protein